MSNEEKKEKVDENYKEKEEKKIKDKKNQNTPKKEEKEEKLEYSKMIGNYILFDQIGMGTFSKVTRAVHILTEQIVAVKILEKEKIEDDIDVERIIREIEILKNISHPNIAKLYETYSTIHNIYLMMEYIEGGDLFDYINSKLFLPENIACYLFRQLIGVIEYLNKMGISHRDIKPENILLDKDKKNIKVIDFGLSNYCPGKNLLHSSCGSPCYASPEMLSGEPYQGITTDIWSSGIVLYSMLVGSLPFDEQELQKLYEQIKIGKFFLPSTLSLEAIDFLKKILIVDPKKRMGLKEIKNHAWFKMEKNPMYKGIIIDEEEYPCDEKVASYIYKQYFKDEQDINIDNIVDMVRTNACNKYTATYYLTKKYILCIEDKYKIIEENNNKENKKKKESSSKLSESSNNKLLYSNKNIINEKNKEKKIKSKKEKNNSKINNDKKNNNEEKAKIRSKTEENELMKLSNKNEKKNNNKNYQSIVINNNKNNNVLEFQNNLIFTENEYYKNNKKVKNKEIKKKSKKNPSYSKKSKEGSKIELSNLNLKNIEIISNGIKKLNKSKQKLNNKKRLCYINLKSLSIKRKNISTITNIKSLTERINDYTKRELNINKISKLIDKNKIRRKKRSPQTSNNNFNFYVINNIIHKDKQEMNNDIFNIKLNHHRKNKSSSLINRKFKNIPLSKTQERINTEIGKINQRNHKLIFINEDLRINKSKNSNENSNIILKKKLSNTNLIINNIKKKINSNANTNKNSGYFNNNKNLSYNNFNNINNCSPIIYNNNSDKFTIKNIINMINNSNCEKKKSKMNNLNMGKNLTNKNDNNFQNKIINTKNKQGNNYLLNYNRQKNILKYITNYVSNNFKRQSHQRNFSYTLRHQLTNFKTDISNKTNTPSIFKKKEQLGNDSLINNPYFPSERSVNNNKFIKQIKRKDFGSNKSHQKNKVIY